MTKTCYKCKTEKPRDAFFKATKKKDGLQSMCKSCQAVNDKLPHRKHSHNKASAKYYKSEKGEAYHADWQFKKKYGISLEQYNSMYTTQDGVCAICNRPESKGVRLSVDHNHNSGEVRELLCHRCNVAIGLVGESQEIISKISQYLLKWNPKT